MEYAIQMLIPIIGGLMLGMWLTKTYGVSPIWTIVLAILGMVGGIAIMYRKFAVPLKKIQSSQLSSPRRNQSGQSEAPGKHINDLDFLYKKYDHHNDDWKELDALDDDVSLDEPPAGGHHPIPPLPKPPQKPSQEDSHPHDL